MLLRWHQARNSSSVSLAIASFFLSFSRRSELEPRARSPQSESKASIPEIGERDKFPPHIFVFVKYHFAALPRWHQRRRMQTEDKSCANCKTSFRLYHCKTFFCIY